MKTIVAGSRGFGDYELLCATLDGLEITEVLSGTATGADILGERWARSKGLSKPRSETYRQLWFGIPKALHEMSA